MIDAARGIEDFFRHRYGRESLYLPSGRLALYMAFREWLRPGDRILMSPVNDDVVFFTVLAAGLVPVLGPVDPATGNLDPAAVDDGAWSGLQAVMTTNLYGIPDRMDLLLDACRRHGLVLIEDACQGFDSRFGGQRIGRIAAVAAFSLTKHIDGTGGVLCFSEGARRDSLVRRARSVVDHRSAGRTIRDHARLIVREASGWLGPLRTLAALRRPFHRVEPEREGHRMPYETGQVLAARQDGAGLDRFHRYVRVDNARYRTEPLSREIRTTLRRLEDFDDNRRRRLAGARDLLALGLTPPSLRLPDDTSLFRVPLFVPDREGVLAHFARRGIVLDYIYDPPLDRYAPPPLTECLASPDSARAWSRDVLPVDPLLADRFLETLRDSPEILFAPTPAVR